MNFESLQVGKPMVAMLEKHGITVPTSIQEQIIPAIKEGRDVLAQSETGSGKTISFAIPIIEQTKRSDGLTTLVLVPTRELCMQVAGEFMKFSSGQHLGVTSVYGGVSINSQARKMKSTNIIVATPGRLIDLLDRNVVKLDKILCLVLDEADRMLDMGFIKDIERILRKMPAKRQTMLFSATVSKEIERLSMNYLDNPKLVTLESKVKPEYLHQTYYKTTPEQRMSMLIHLLKHERDLALVFCNKKHVTAKLAKKLTSQGVLAKCLHGDMSQPQRERVTADFRNKKINVLIATDVAARGLHIEDITHVYNYEIPRDVESYTHRVGRTARAGKKGEAISLVATEEDKKFFKQILFTYGGSITLKFVDPSELPYIEEKPKEKGKRHNETEAPRGDAQRRNKRPEHPDRGRGRKPERPDRPERPSRDNRKRNEGVGQPARVKKHHSVENELAPKEGLRRTEDNLQSHAGRHKQREEFEKSQRERQKKHSSGTPLPNERPRKRKPFERETDVKNSRREEIPDMKRETRPAASDDKKKKRNWKEMWERLING